MVDDQPISEVQPISNVGQWRILAARSCGADAFKTIFSTGFEYLVDRT
jgi:hypothetical protein